MSLRPLALFGATLICLLGSDAGEVPDGAAAGLRVEVDGGWVPLSPASVHRVVRWESLRPGLELSSFPLSAPGEGKRTRAVVLRLDPARYQLGLDTHLRGARGDGRWTVDQVDSTVVAAFNGGQFSGGTPWGWTVLNGEELSPPGTGPLSLAVVVNQAGAIRLVEPDSIAAVRAGGDVRLALQSYPALLLGEGSIPVALTRAGQGVDVTHRDARLVLGQQADGRLLIVLTRFDALGAGGGSIPFGLTLGETAALVQALGCRRAVALDGGISAQLMVRSMTGRQVWRGWRRVPVGIVVQPRP
jgi:exopolysaccharide biosynthesis protein